MQINTVDSIQSNGGAVSNKSVGTAFIAVGAITSGAWSIGSHVHTIVASPLISIGALGTAGALAGGGWAIAHKKAAPASGQTVNVSASAA
ncbi:hypothetical protein N8654_02195 [Synechococcus sp. AH-601-B19]|nr:hypothetical protein [Synechococcus sp. AH-601-B19]